MKPCTSAGRSPTAWSSSNVTGVKWETYSCLFTLSWIPHCRSQHEEIELVSEEEYYATAPEAISKPVSSL